jgi:hypothetical protein
MELWTPSEGMISFSPDKIEDVLVAYSLFLEVCYPEHKKHFEARLRSNPDAARSEAVVFSWLRAQGHRPKIAESPEKGGMDYICFPDTEGPFLIEVTSLKKEAVELRSGWPDELNEVARSFSMITPNLWSKALDKAPQLGGHDFPRVLCISLIHVGASVLVGTLAAEWLMMSEPKIEIPVGLEGNQIKARNVTNLKKSAFFRIHNGAIQPVRQSISAILLISIWNDQLAVVGMLHPVPSVPFNYRIFREVPFLKIKWPIESNTISTEWVIGHPNPKSFYHHKVIITDAEYRGE